MAKKVLCIEDEEVIAGLYANALRQGGYEVVLEPDGQKGLGLAQTDTYDIILLDLMLPSMSGVDVLRALKNPTLTPHFHGRIIIITNLEARSDIRADIERHADAYLIKAEITPRQLVEFINNIPAV